MVEAVLNLSADHHKLEWFESSLQRCADMLDDITPMVAKAFYAKHPEARAKFAELYSGSSGQLEGEMVQQVLYCLMTWYAAPREIEIVVLSTFPHHVETLGVTPDHFSGFIDSVCAVIGTTIPADAIDERVTLDDLTGQFGALVRKGLKLVRSHART